MDKLHGTSYAVSHDIYLASVDNDSIIRYEYDFAGRRISKTVDGTITKYCYDGDQVIAEYDGSDNLLRKFVYGPGIDEPICMVDVDGGNVLYYYHGACPGTP